MGLNVSKGNMYEFITHTWNTVKGKCPHDCTYCYMKRWGKQNDIYFDNKEIKTPLGHDNFIFVGSSCDLFAENIPEEWIFKTLNRMNEYKNKYLLQTKNPARLLKCIDRFYEIPITVCTTIETNRIYKDIMKNSPSPFARAFAMELIRLPKYVTIEPILDFDMKQMVSLIKSCNPKQVNIGADSGNNGLPEPSFSKVLELIENLKTFTTVVNKKNLNRLGEF